MIENSVAIEYLKPIVISLEPDETSVSAVISIDGTEGIEVPLCCYNELYDSLIREIVWAMYLSSINAYTKIGFPEPEVFLEVRAAQAHWRKPYPNPRNDREPSGKYVLEMEMISAVYVAAMGDELNSRMMLSQFLDKRRAKTGR